METAQGEELYVSHSGEQMSFEEAIQRCPFLQSFGETALLEIREELAAYKVPAEVENVQKTADAFPAEAATKTENKSEPEAAVIQRSDEVVAARFEVPEKSKAKEAASEALITEAVLNNLLVVEEKEAQTLAENEHPEPLKKEPLKNIKTKTAPKISDEKVASSLPKKSEPAVLKAENPSTLMAEVSVYEVTFAEQAAAERPETFAQVFETPEAEVNPVPGQVAEISAELQISDVPQPELSDEIFLEIEETIFNPTQEDTEIFEKQMPELESSVTEKFDNLEPEQVGDIQATLDSAYAVVEKMAEIIISLKTSEFDGSPAETQTSETEPLEERLEIYIKELEIICEQLLERLEIPAEPKNVQMLMRLLSQPEFKGKLIGKTEIYSLGTHEAKTTDVSLVTGKVINFVSSKEAKVAMLGRRVLGQLNCLQALSPAA